MQDQLPRVARGRHLSAPHRGASFVRAGSLVLAAAFVAFFAACGGRETPTDIPNNSGGGPQRPPALVLSPTNLQFSAHAGGIDPLGQLVSITGGGDTSVGDVSVTGVTYGAGQPRDWIRVQVLGSILPAELVVRAVTGALPVGVHTATITMASSDATDRPQNVLVTFTVSPP